MITDFDLKVLREVLPRLLDLVSLLGNLSSEADVELDEVFEGSTVSEFVEKLERIEAGIRKITENAKR